jgi:hypothetical protein
MMLSDRSHQTFAPIVDMRLDWGASKFVTKQWQVGLVGYVYQQISGDRGSGDRVGSFESRVLGVGPQLGYVLQINNKYQGYLDLKGYKEFDASNPPLALLGSLHGIDRQCGRACSSPKLAHPSKRFW